jgi:V/A-type H+/Na+-transporting ATPase subunit E
MAEHPTAAGTASGLEALIARLRDEGVMAGRAEAEQLVADAQARAHKIVQKADADAKSLVDAAQREAENLKRAGEEALNVAARDTVLELKDQLAKRFAEQVVKTVSAATRDPALLERMILEIVGRARIEGGVDQAREVEVILPRDAIGLDELRRRPEEMQQGSLALFVAATSGEMLREGVTFARSEDEEGGIRLQLKDRSVSIDISDRAVADAILVHLQPRFRALLEGVVK